MKIQALYTLAPNNTVLCNGAVIATLELREAHKWHLHGIEGGVMMPTDFYATANDALTAAVRAHRQARRTNHE